LPDSVDESIFFDTILGSLSFKKRTLFSFFLGAGDGYEIGAYPAAFINFIRNAPICKAEMAGRFAKW